MVDSILSEYLSDGETAEQLHRTPRTLQRWRRSRIGPPVTWVGRDPYYFKPSLLAWLRSQEREMVRSKRARAA